MILSNQKSVVSKIGTADNISYLCQIFKEVILNQDLTRFDIKKGNIFK